MSGNRRTSKRKEAVQGKAPRQQKKEARLSRAGTPHHPAGQAPIPNQLWKAGNTAITQLLERRTGESHEGQMRKEGIEDHSPPFPVNAEELTGILGRGKPLEGDLQQHLAGMFGEDFSQVRIHDDGIADHLSRTLGAEAFTVGKHMAFREGNYDPGTAAGRGLLAHEAQHVASGQAAQVSPGAQGVQLKQERIDDVTTEMVGLPFTLRSAQGSGANQIPKGTTVTIVDWKGLSRTATVEATVKGKKITLDVPKLALEPASPKASGVRHYKVGLGAQQGSVEKGMKGVDDQRAKVKDWEARKGGFKKNPKAWEDNMKDLSDELKRREEEIAKKEATLSRMLVRQTMFNLFDPIIVKWVDHYNKTLAPKTKLDPNIAKSMLFQETRMGTTGEHLELPPYSWTDPNKHPIRSRFNLMQAIDSYGEQQLLMIEEMALPIFTKYKLDELKKLNKAKSMTNDELIAWGGGALWNAMKEYNQLDPATNKNLMGTTGKELYLDYSYWIRTGIRWLFFKYSITNDWGEAVRAFVGRPDPKKAPKEYKRSQNYKKDVLGRTGNTKDLEIGDK
jgi:hypothetical protein